MDPGTSLGPYRIDRKLGAGGMGRVYAATLTRPTAGLAPGTTVAVKVVHPHLLEDGDAAVRFAREIDLGKTVAHPNVVRTYDGGEIDGHHYLAMEYVEGQTLDALREGLDRVPEELCRHIAREVCRGLGAIHAAGAIHRDVKPENVLITPDHVVKIMDLGVACDTDVALRLSRTGVFVGSLHYAAPEQFRRGGKDLDGRVDLHALGLVLYELATAEIPYYADELEQVLKKVLHEEPRRIGEINPQLSAFFEELVHCLLAKDREERFASAEALFAVLESGEESDWWRERARALRIATRRPIRRVRIPRETAVHGRESEIATLRALYERAKASGGNVVLIDGEAGIGKSRLVDEFVARLCADGEDVNFLFGGYPPGGAATAAGGFSSAYREHLGEAGCTRYLGHLQLLAPAFDALLQGGVPPAGVERLTKDSLQACFVSVTRALAAERPTVILIDDLHFAPDEGRALFMALAMAVPGSRVLLLGTARPGVSEDWLAALTRLDQASRIALQRLGTKDLVALLQDSFRSEDLARTLGLQIAMKSDGNPFFAFEIIRGLREGQFITEREDGSWVSTRAIDEIQIPSSVLDLVSARVADLSEDERNLLDVAACWGFEFDPLLVGEALGIARIPLLRQLGQIERRHRLVRAAGVNYAFDHHQVQEALYGSLSELLRREYHAALAETLEARAGAGEKEPETLDGALNLDLCEHYLKGARGESALRYLPAAQSHLEKGHLHAHVVALTERALAVPGLLTGAARATALSGMCGSLDLLARRVRQEECAREIDRLADGLDDDDLRYRAATELGKVVFRRMSLDEAEASFRRALDIARGRSDEKGEAGSIVNLGNTLLSQGRLAEAQDCYERGLARSREIGHGEFEANATLNLGNVLRARGRLPEARELFERAVALSREVGHHKAATAAMGNLGLVLIEQGRLAEAREWSERSLALSRQVGNRQSEAHVMGNLGGILLDQGRLAESQQWSERYIALSREIGERRGEAVAVGMLSRSLLLQGRLSEAWDHGERELLLCRKNTDQAGEVGAEVFLANVLSEQGELERSDERLEAAVELSERIGHDLPRASAQLALGSLRVAASGGAEGRALLESARDAAREHEFASIETRACCRLAVLPGEDARDALAAFRKREQRLPWSEAREVHLLLWRATGDRTHLAAAKRLLDEALPTVREEHRESMRQNVRVHREILATWRDEYGEEGGDARAADPGESPTRDG